MPPRGERLVEQPPVGDAGERVARRQALDLLEQRGVPERRRRVHRRLGERVDGEHRDPCIVVGHPTRPPRTRTARRRRVTGTTTTFAAFGSTCRAVRRRACARGPATCSTASRAPAACCCPASRPTTRRRRRRHTPHHSSPRCTSTTDADEAEAPADVLDEHGHAVFRPMRTFAARNRAPPATGVARWLCRSDRSFTQEKAAAAHREDQERRGAHDREPIAHRVAGCRRSPASAAACASRSNSAHQVASLSPVRYETSSVAATTSEEHEEQQRTPVAPGVRYRDGEYETVDEHRRRDQCRIESRDESPRESRPRGSRARTQAPTAPARSRRSS